MKEYLLFDLDGTLTDPKLGITSCVQYALRSFGIEEPDLDKLEPFIGPPLKESFMEFYQLSEKDALAAVEKYRERYHDTGIYENKLYDGIPEMLRALKAQGLHLAVASSKPEVYVKQILQHYKIIQYFEVITGSELDGSRVNKDEVIAEALKRLFLDNEIAYDKVYMIGDRKFDVEGAKTHHVEGVGVTYGYGSLEELKAAKADYIVRSVEELTRFLLRGAEEEKKQTGFNRMLWQIAFPFLLFWLVRQVVWNALALLLEAAGLNGFTGSVAEFFLVWDEEGNLVAVTGNAGTIMNAIGCLAGAAAIWKPAKAFISRAGKDMRLAHLKKETPRQYIMLFTAALGAVIGVNLLMELLEAVNYSAAYQETAASQYSAAFLVGLVCYGIVTPFAEELLFRGIIYNSLKRFVSLRFALILSAFCFGFYHMNSVQGTYAFIMGCLMAYAYEYFGSFTAPLLIHMLSNLLSYSLSYTKLANTAFISWPVCIIFLALGIFSVLLMHKDKKIL